MVYLEHFAAHFSLNNTVEKAETDFNRSCFQKRYFRTSRISNRIISIFLNVSVLLVEGKQSLLTPAG